MKITRELVTQNMRYLQLLSQSFPTVADASTEIINNENAKYATIKSKAPMARPSKIC